ncbi:MULTISPECIES: hypothetical protein [Anoxybacillus]|uniref:Uncharacterized protein n=1 Tax=Anoxybacillus flavithermus TaxID=33934 RepID=A0A178TGB5_9BACL|nr:hypothetical protein [Anoxybacillus flavithermus]ASA95850.1 hypothetical protein CA592_02750 [Anoxybacillus flavithermus]MBE2905658.1 hypothetical protein [Anoxybacillus flavithermus]MBE2909125.1 hypothetical protein [Anoxybacillus flavithermus]MBE2910687.1 hypothetical protein [Anoxybacillus flavithermus]MBE2917265.1 hypothetical protein [Anoxybacillus flavithermus]
MGVELTALHWIYVSFICIIIALMIWRKDTSLACMVGIFLLAITATGSLPQRRRHSGYIRYGSSVLQNIRCEGGD